MPSITSRAERGELGAAVIDRRRVHRAQHAVGDVGRAGNLQEVAAGGFHNVSARSGGRGKCVSGSPPRDAVR